MSKSFVQVEARSTIADISSSLDTDALIDLYELDMGSVPYINKSDILRFHAGTNNLDREVVWQGNVYFPYPIEIKGFSLSGTKQIPRPTMSVANITTTSHGMGWGSISGLTRDYDDLVGVQVSRKRTYARFLDNFCIKLDNSVAAGICTDTEYSDSKTDCIREGNGWDPYSCATCASEGGTWYVNNNSNWEVVVDNNQKISGGHEHDILISPSVACSLGSGNRETVVTEPNIFEYVDIFVLESDLNPSGGIETFALETAGRGYSNNSDLELIAIPVPVIAEGQASAFPGQNSHIHTFGDLEAAQAYALVQGTLAEVELDTGFQDSHSHVIKVTYNTGLQQLEVVFVDNHTLNPHVISAVAITPAVFGNIVLTEEGRLSSFDIISAGAGYPPVSIIILIPSSPSHTHIVDLEYMYEGTDEALVSSNASWHASSGASVTPSYDSGDEGFVDCIRVEANGISDWGFTDINTFKDTEYNISFKYKNIIGSSQKIELESDKGDGTWHLEYSELLPGTGWQEYNKTFFTDEIDRLSRRTRVKIYAASNTGGSEDEILVSDFIAQQTWVRGDLLARSIGSNTADNHTLNSYHNLVINTADPEAYFEDDIYFIDRKSAESKIIIEFELAPAWDVEGIKLPKREIIQNTCLWEYKGTGGCGYTEARYFDKGDQPTSDSPQDYCAKKLSSCELRFAVAEPQYSEPIEPEGPEGPEFNYYPHTSETCAEGAFYWNSSVGSCWNLNKAVLPYGGFPGVGLGLRR